MSDPIDALDWDKGAGLLPAIVQHATTGRVLMLGYVNEAALARTRATGLVTFFSRSRQQLWTKGETSGNRLELVGIEVDCDRDTLLIQATPRGPTCHLDRPSCFDEGDPKTGFGFIGQLERVIGERLATAAAGSYTAELAAAGSLRIAQKIGEEGVELALAATQDDQQSLLGEAADLTYHLLVLLHQRQLAFSDVAETLAQRHRDSAAATDAR
jgi:phosphoribosyl-ATP pyrophosphohydrolase/phosphoribosyl-AMP cyclohydrolase